MTTLSYAWTTYARFQSRLSSFSTVDDHAWGLEGALNVILERDFCPTVIDEDEFRRAAARASRKHRDHLARFLTESNEEVDFPDAKNLLSQVVAKQALRAIEAGLDQPEDRELLLAIGEGRGYEDVARLLNQPASSLRSKTLRLRRKFAHFKP